jgi:hypothetical protein
LKISKFPVSCFFFPDYFNSVAYWKFRANFQRLYLKNKKTFTRNIFVFNFYSSSPITDFFLTCFSRTPCIFIQSLLVNYWNLIMMITYCFWNENVFVLEGVLSRLLQNRNKTRLKRLVCCWLGKVNRTVDCLTKNLNRLHLTDFHLPKNEKNYSKSKISLTDFDLLLGKYREHFVIILTWMRF